MSAGLPSDGCKQQCFRLQASANAYIALSRSFSTYASRHSVGLWGWAGQLGMQTTLLSQRGLRQQAAPQSCSRQRPFRSRKPVSIQAAKKDEPSREDRSNPNKADFSAYWSLKFKEFFSKRRQYLELSRKRQEPPEYVKKLDAQIKQQEDKLEEARIAAG